TNILQRGKKELDVGSRQRTREGDTPGVEPALTPLTAQQTNAEGTIKADEDAEQSRMLAAAVDLRMRCRILLPQLILPLLGIRERGTGFRVHLGSRLFLGLR